MIFLPHDDVMIQSMALTHDGNFLLTIPYNSDWIMKWDLMDGMQKRFAPRSAKAFKQFNRPRVNKLAMLKDQTIVVGIASRESITCYDLTTGQLLKDLSTLTLHGLENHYSICPCIASDSNLIDLLYLASGDLPRFLNPHGQVIPTNPGSWFLDLISKLEYSGGPIVTIELSCDCQTVAIGFDNGKVEIRSVVDGTLESTWKWDVGSIDCIAFSPDDHWIVAGGSEEIVIWDRFES